MNTFELISVEKAKMLAGEPGYMVVDLRSSEDFYKNHIENALNIPDADISAIQKFDRQEDIWIFYCRRGSASFRLASDLARVGYKTMAVVGGYK